MVQCKNCNHCRQDFITAYDGRGMLEISLCEKDILKGKVVDPEANRDCDNFVTEEVHAA